MKAEKLGFKYLRKCGTGVMHIIVISMCLLLSAVVCFNFKFAVDDFPPLLKIPISLIFLFIAANYFSSYFMAIFTDPGHPPEPDEINPICEKCGMTKPLRTHHCSLCGKCCLRYDHHCPWIANCVGLRNYCHFLKFVTTGMLAGGFSLLISVFSLLFKKYALHIADTPLRIMACIVMPLFTFVSAMCAGIMSFTHYPEVFRNETSIECYENSVDAKRAKELGMPYSYPFDNGLMQNVREIFGENWLIVMVMPFLEPKQKNDGLNYKAKVNCGL